MRQPHHRSRRCAGGAGCDRRPHPQRAGLCEAHKLRDCGVTHDVPADLSAVDCADDQPRRLDRHERPARTAAAEIFAITLKPFNSKILQWFRYKARPSYWVACRSTLRLGEVALPCHKALGAFGQRWPLVRPGLQVMPASKRETYVVTLRPLPGIDRIRALRSALKALRPVSRLFETPCRISYRRHGLMHVYADH